MADWTQLPDLLLAHIFSYLSTSARLYLHEVCSQWAAAASRPEVWHTFSLCEDPSLLNMLELVSIVLQRGNRDPRMDEMLKQKYLGIIRNFGKHFQSVKLYYNSSSTGNNSDEIINCLAENCHRIKQLKVVKIHGYVNVVNNHENPSKKAVYQLINQNTGLQLLDVKGLDTITYDSTISQQQDILPLGAGHSQQLQKLYVFQSFQGTNLSNLMYLVNLKVLAIEPKVLTYSLLYHLAGQALKDLHIVALSRLTQFYNEALQDWQWKEICKQSPNFRVHCHFGVGQEWTEKEIMLKGEMPVKTLRYQKHDQLRYSGLSPLLMSYSSTLEVFIDVSLSLEIYENGQRKSILDPIAAINVHILNFVRACPKLRILIVKEVLLSSTILAMLATNKNLEIILMEDQLQYDVKNILLRQTNITPPLPPDVLEVINRGHSDEAGLTNTLKQLGATGMKLFHRLHFTSLMLEKYVQFCQ